MRKVFTPSEFFSVPGAFSEFVQCCSAGAKGGGADAGAVIDRAADVVGTDPRILDLLEENGIDYVIHLPWRPTQR